ncbi:MAG: AAA family ATPase [Chlamydiales bacterium]|nr:AAA family ATPase [Chlamydiales bacterium]MBY0529929.1 AAA family ATPase [Rhabdochlamydiaceae bacterium]
MAIGYARVEFVQRSHGKSACAKAAYNSRSRIEFEGNCVMSPEIYDWTDKEKPAFHEVLLPKGANEKFKTPNALWNEAELAESRINSVVGLDLLLALPDDQVISLEDRIHLARSFIQKHFVDKGLAAQIDIHHPEKKIQIMRDNRELGLFKGMSGNIIQENQSSLKLQLENGKTVSFNPKDFTGFSFEQSNWHAHVLVTTRRFQKDGLGLEEKARDLMPQIAKGKVVSGSDWGKLWTDHQNQFFTEKGIDLRVDLPGIESQEHLGPYRMRGRAFELLKEHGRILEVNLIKAKDVSCVLDKITERLSVFTKEDVDRFLHNHVPSEMHKDFKDAFWKQAELVPLVNKETGELLGKFSSAKVVEEEKRIMRLSEEIYSKNALKVNLKKSAEFSKGLNEEQSTAFSKILAGPRLSCIHGYAGTGKSHLLVALKNVYENSGYEVRAFGSDSATADVLRGKGFNAAENVYRFLFSLHNSKRTISKGKEVWILDEAGKLGNRPLLEFLKEAEKKDVQVIFSGDYAQLNSVGRGGMFKVFCEQFNSHVLQEIQRQKQEQQREISKNLAVGELGLAIDKLSSNSTLRWTSLKNEAMEQLISTWARDTRSVPQASTLIIAHSNDEVRVLNEMVRIIRKQRGELAEREFSCETTLGKVYLSVGDTIEFRKNEKSLGVTNGMAGVLVEADQNKFVVTIRDNPKKPQTVIFNPQEYHAYQLGYASTYFRSQGKTINRAYVLHSPALNKKLFYVGLTRHVDEAYYFVSKDQAYCLSDLKWQAMREDVKENTLNFTTGHEVERLQELQKNRTEIQALKESDSFLFRMKGYGLAAFELVKTKALSVGEHLQDRALSKEFYNPELSSSNIKASVSEVASEPETILETILSQERNLALSPLTLKDQPASLSASEDIFQRCQQKKERIWKAFEAEKQVALEKYFTVSSSVISLKAIVDLHHRESSQKLESTEYFKAWQKACGDRNTAAQELVKVVSSDELSSFLGKKMAGYVQNQADRYAESIEKRENAKSFDIEEGLKSHLEPLLYRLFPEGPSRKERTSFRFGAKGSLSVACSGDKVGQFYDFERQEGGGPLKLVQRELGLGTIEAKEWAKQFLGIAHEIKVPKVFLKSIAGSHKEKNSDWISLPPDPNVPAPCLEELSNRKLHIYFEEVTRHPYRDEKGQLLYYVLRLKDKNDSTKKITPPLSFGYWKSNPENHCWALKGFQTEKNFIYNQNQLFERPHATVLVVEGEKTADRAHEKFPGEDLIYATWQGGAGAVQHTNWNPLAGRNIIIWPDNDKAGLEAQESLCRELRRVGVRSLRSIDSKVLQANFPMKWDLADPLPPNLKDSLPKELLKEAPHKAIDPQQLLYRTSGNHEKSRANEILWRVDERLRSALEVKFANQPWKINEEILSEAAKILVEAEKPQKIIKRIHGDFNKEYHLSWQVAIYRAHHGKDPSDWEIAKMKEVITDLRSFLPSQLTDLDMDKAFTKRFEQALSRKEMRKEPIQEMSYNMPINKVPHEELLLSQVRSFDIGGIG